MGGRRLRHLTPVRRGLVTLFAIVAVTVASTRAPAGSTAGTRIVFDNDGVIITVGSDGTRVAVLTKGHVDCSPVWSPDRGRIAFARAQRPTGTPDCRDAADASVYTMNAAGGEVRRLIAHAAWPAWSPAASRLAFFRGNGLYVVRSGGGAARRIASRRPSFPDGAADWSPDGSRIVFSSGGRLELVRADGSRLRRIVTVPPLALTDADGNACGGAFVDPAWSPDGRRISYTDYVQCGGTVASAIVSIRPDGSDRRLIVGFGGSWSPSGARLAFFYYDGTGDRLATVDVRTRRIGDVRRALADDVGRGRPDWR